jgi:chaperonin cofactor prefoldin
MSENLLQTLQHLIQDVIAPDVRELKVRASSVEKQIDTRFDAVSSRFDAFEKQMNARFEAIDAKFEALEARFEAIDAKFEALDARMKLQESLAQARFEAILSAISESKSQAELAAFRAVAPVSERVAVLEAQRQ